MSNHNELPQAGCSLGSPTITINQIFSKSILLPAEHFSHWGELRRAVPAKSENRNIAHYLCISLYNQMKNTLKINAELCKQYGYQDVTELCLFNPNTAEQSV